MPLMNKYLRRWRSILPGEHGSWSLMLTPFLIGAARATAAALPAGQLAVLPGQTHDINPEATAPAITGFLS